MLSSKHRGATAAYDYFAFVRTVTSADRFEPAFAADH
jgi:hypothetical protein